MHTHRHTYIHIDIVTDVNIHIRMHTNIHVHVNIQRVGGVVAQQLKIGKLTASVQDPSIA